MCRGPSPFACVVCGGTARNQTSILCRVTTEMTPARTRIAAARKYLVAPCAKRRARRGEDDDEPRRADGPDGLGRDRVDEREHGSYAIENRGVLIARLERAINEKPDQAHVQQVRERGRKEQLR